MNSLHCFPVAFCSLIKLIESFEWIGSFQAVGSLALTGSFSLILFLSSGEIAPIS